MPGQKGRCGGHRGNAQDILAPHAAVDSRWVTHGPGRHVVLVAPLCGLEKSRVVH